MGSDQTLRLQAIRLHEPDFRASEDRGKGSRLLAGEDNPRVVLDSRCLQGRDEVAAAHGWAFIDAIDEKYDLGAGLPGRF